MVGDGRLGGTKFGISAASFPTLDIRNLSLDQARAIYRFRYWNPIAGDALPYGIALLAFDAAVNQGVGAAARMLQRSVGGLAIDGAIGPKSVAAIGAADPKETLGRLGAERALGYARDPDVITFGRGWYARLFRVFLLAQSSLGDPYA